MKIVIANKSHAKFAEVICTTIEESAKIRGTGIARRTPEYVITKMENGNAIIALDGDKFAGFCYIETWSHEKYVANSGLIVHPDYRNQGLAKDIKKAVKSNAKIVLFPENCSFMGPGKVMFKNAYYENVHPTLRMARELANKYKIFVLLGSISGHKGSFDDSYAATKGAIHSLVKSLALKFSPNIRVIGIAPGMTNNTKMTNNLVEGQYSKTLSKIPLKYAGEPEDIAELILFLINKHAKFITGSIIDVNGGQYLR
mgnify:CR=1 FL=1